LSWRQREERDAAGRVGTGCVRWERDGHGDEPWCRLRGQRSEGCQQ
jgi:hypothetical protein